MTKCRRPYYFAISVAFSFLVASSTTNSSSFSECHLIVLVSEFNTQGTNPEISDINIRVVAVNEEKSHLCSFVVGQEIEIGKPVTSDVPVSAIQPGTSLRMQYGTYSGMGANGVAIAGESWSILELVEVLEK